VNNVNMVNNFSSFVTTPTLFSSPTERYGNVFLRKRFRD
jgi:hypothetical protein